MFFSVVRMNITNYYYICCFTHVPQSKRVAAEAKLTKLIASSQENRIQWRADVLTAHERCQFLEEQLREARRGSTKLIQVTRKLDMVQHTLGIAQGQATVAEKLAQDSHQKLVIMEQKSKKCSNIISTSRQTRTQWRADLLKAHQKIQSLEEQLREARRGSTKLTQMTRQLDHVQRTLVTAEEKVVVGETLAVKAQVKLKTVQRKRKTENQRLKRREGTSTEETTLNATQRLISEIEVMKMEALKYECDLEATQSEVEKLREKNKEQHLLMTRMQVLIDKPEPLIDFGLAQETYSFDVFRFAAKILNCKLTCMTAHRVTAVFMEEFFPGKNIRIPPPTQWELWRQDMLLAGRYKALKVMRLCDHYHSYHGRCYNRRNECRKS